MPPDPGRVREVRDWLTRASRDLDAAAALLGSKPPFPDTALFLCQQAVEKSWKGLLSWRGVAFRKTHDLRELGS